ncbi:MAG TPA: S-methyl-5'-thioadenosine phosphorylase [Polyangiaceae bacterium]
MAKTRLGIIGGSGVYQMAAIEAAQWRRISSPWGAPSDELLFGNIGATECVFLPRHGRGHRLTPGTINYRANIDAMKRAGVTDVISISACGSFKESLPPGTFVFVDQFVDLTKQRESSFFGTGLVAHVSMAHPVCSRLREQLVIAAQAAGIAHQDGGTYVCMEGPQFSTLAESLYYRAQGWDVIGMTNATEAKLAREAELPYACVAMVTDFDCWHPDHDAVEVADIVRVLNENAEKSATLIQRTAPNLGPERQPSPMRIEYTLDTAIMTAPDRRDPQLMAKLDAVAGRALGIAMRENPEGTG